MNNNIVFLLLPLSLVLDILTDTVFEKGGMLSYLKAFIYYSLIFYSLLYGLRIKDNVNRVFIIFFMYVFLQIPFSSHPLESLRMSLKILMSIMMFPVGYYFINSFDKLKVLNNSVVLSMIIYIGNYIISQYFGIGVSVYTDEKDFVIGNLQDNWNVITYMLLVVPVILLTQKKTKKVIFLSSILVLLLIISLKRIAILGICIGFIIYILKTGKFFKSIGLAIVFTLIFYISLPIFGSLLSNRIEARGDKLSGGSAVSIVEKEQRFLETIAVWGEIGSFENLPKAFFGLEAFYSVGNYGSGSFNERQIHIDYNLIVNTIGIVGLLLYLMIFYFIFKKRQKLKITRYKNKTFRELDSVFYVLFFTQFITSFGGQMYAFTFRIIIFLYLGAILGIMYKETRSNIGMNNTHD
jgi:hypothetical protein